MRALGAPDPATGTGANVRLHESRVLDSGDHELELRYEVVVGDYTATAVSVRKPFA